MVGQTKSWGLHGFETTSIQQHEIKLPGSIVF
jgi:hypothetical protein